MNKLKFQTSAIPTQEQSIHEAIEHVNIDGVNNGLQSFYQLTFDTIFGKKGQHFSQREMRIKVLKALLVQTDT